MDEALLGFLLRRGLNEVGSVSSRGFLELIRILWIDFSSQVLPYLTRAVMVMSCLSIKWELDEQMILNLPSNLRVILQ